MPLDTSALVRSCKMDNVTIITDTEGNEHAVIDRGNGEFTSMPKAIYDAQQAEQSTPILSDEA